MLLHIGCVAGNPNDKLQTAIHAKSAPSSAAEVAREISAKAQKLQSEISSIHANMGSADDKLNSIKELKSKLATKTVKGNELADAEEKVQKMKAAVHAAAMIKQNAIHHLALSHSAGPRNTGGQPIYPKKLTLHASGLFADGPYVIMAVLATILLTFCFCAFSSRPTSMSGKYDMRR